MERLFHSRGKAFPMKKTTPLFSLFYTDVLPKQRRCFGLCTPMFQKPHKNGFRKVSLRPFYHSSSSHVSYYRSDKQIKTGFYLHELLFNRIFAVVLTTLTIVLGNNMKRIRQYIGIFTALVTYYIVHEGAHLIYAMSKGVFKQVNFMSLGVQVDIFRERMTDTQLGWFCLAGPIATFLFAWLLVLKSKRLCARLGAGAEHHSPVLLACCWYVSIIMLLLDPLYLSVIYRFVGGGDMNGIRLLMPEALACTLFGILFVLHLVVLWKVLLPRYKKGFEGEA